MRRRLGSTPAGPRRFLTSSSLTPSPTSLLSSLSLAIYLLTLVLWFLSRQRAHRVEPVAAARRPPPPAARAFPACPALPTPSTDGHFSVLAVTSMTRPYRDHAAMDQEWRHTLWERIRVAGSIAGRVRHAKGTIPLWVFNENEWEVKHNRSPLNSTDFPIEPDCLLDVFSLEKQGGVLRRAETSIDAFFRLHARTPGLSQRIMDGKVLLRKIASISAAMDALSEGDLLLWLDVDVVPQKPLDEAFFDFARARDVSYLAESPCWRDLTLTQKNFEQLSSECHDLRVDTGVLALRVGPKTRALVDWWMTSYLGPVRRLAAFCFLQQDSEELLPGEDPVDLLRFFDRTGGTTSLTELCARPEITSNLGLNDIYTFALGLQAFQGELEHGWFAASDHQLCASRAPGLDRKLPGGYCYACPSGSAANAEAGSLVSRFSLDKYLRHVKGGHGIMARQHWGHQKAPRTTTSDPGLLLPPEYFPIQVHIDHRMACGDKRGAYGKRWSLRQPEVEREEEEEDER